MPCHAPLCPLPLLCLPCCPAQRPSPQHSALGAAAARHRSPAPAPGRGVLSGPARNRKPRDGTPTPPASNMLRGEIFQNIGPGKIDPPHDVTGPKIFI
jgi:hypothetical protein